MKTYLLLEVMKEKRVSRTELATHLDIAYNTFNLKINGKRPFTIIEVNKISNYLNLSSEQYLSIFFANEVA